MEQGCDLLDASKKGKDASKKTEAHKGQCSGLGGLASPSSFLSPFLLASSLKHCIRVPSFLVPFIFLAPLLGLHSLGIAMFVLFSCSV